MVVTPCLERAGPEREFLRALRQAIDLSIDKFGDGLDDPDVLRAQAGLLALAPRFDHMDRAARQRGERDRLPHDGAAAGIARPVDRQHESRGE